MFLQPDLNTKYVFCINLEIRGLHLPLTRGFSSEPRAKTNFSYQYGLIHDFIKHYIIYLLYYYI